MKGDSGFAMDLSGMDFSVAPTFGAGPYDAVSTGSSYVPDTGGAFNDSFTIDTSTFSAPMAETASSSFYSPAPSSFAPQTPMSYDPLSSFSGASAVEANRIANATPITTTPTTSVPDTSAFYGAFQPSSSAYSYDPLSGNVVPTSTAPATSTYRVQPGDTLSGIAKDAGISLQELYDLNPKFKTDPKYQGGNMIWSGTTVKLPGQAQPTPAVISPVEPPPAEPTGGGDPGGGDFGGGDFGPVYVPPTPPAPTVEPVIVSPPPPAIKTAQPDIVIFDEEVIPAEVLINLVLEDIGGHELINIARNDTINGQNITYQPISNLSLIQQKNNPNNMINLQQTEKQYFSGFPIDLESKIPQNGSGLNGANFLINIFGDLIFQFVNLNEDEEIEIQIIQNDIINILDEEE